MLDQSYQKTEAGRAEIKLRALQLSRSARNLLLMLDGTRSARDWLAMINGTTETDLAFLASHGLIVSTTIASPPPAPAEALPDVEGMGYDELYSYLTQNAKKLLGLIKGYRMVLDVERCTDLAGLQELAWRLVSEVDRAQGDEAAERVRRELRL